MGMADSDNANGSGGGSGNSGGSPGGGRSSGGRGTSPSNDTPGNPNAADGKRGSTMGKKGGTAPDSSNPGGRDTPGAKDGNGRGRTDNVAPDGRGSQTPGANPRARRTADPAAQDDGEDRSTRQGMNKVGRIADTEEGEKEAEKSFMDSVKSLFSSEEEGPTVAENVRNLRELDVTLTEKEIAKAVLGDEEASLESAINAEQESGFFSQAAQFAGTMFGGVPGMVAGETLDAAVKAKAASDTIEGLNKTGMTMDDSFANSMHSQTVGAFAGKVGSKLGSKTGAAFGAKVAGAPGAKIGGLFGSALGGVTRDAAMTGTPSEGRTDRDNGPSNATGGGMATNVASAQPSNTTSQPSSNGGGLVASAMTSQPNAATAQPASQQANFSTDYDYGINTSQGFSAYGSYARQFFG